MKCNKCGRRYKYYYKDKKGHTLKFCNSCNVNNRRFERKLKAIKYKGGGCAKCGYNVSPYALDFHHINRLDKTINISGSHCRSWNFVKKELDKCILLCANCHREIEHNVFELLT